jgi:hypothetical protein
MEISIQGDDDGVSLQSEIQNLLIACGEHAVIANMAGRNSSSSEVVNGRARQALVQ